jgi:hypothetical protein
MMGRRAGRAGIGRALLLPLGLACVALGMLQSCRDPTEITVVITTDVHCSRVQGTSITVGTPGSVENAQPTTATTDCTDTAAGASIGSIVSVPQSDRSGQVEVRVVLGVDGTDPTSCVAPSYHGCVVERRQLRYLPETPLVLPIRMPIGCLGVPCTPDTTCYGDPPVCAPSSVDPGMCTDPNSMTCNPSTDGGFTPDTGGDVIANDGPQKDQGTSDTFVGDGNGGDSTGDDGSSDVTADNTTDNTAGDGGGNDGTMNDSPADTFVGDTFVGDTFVGDNSGGDVFDAGGPDGTLDGPPIDAPPDMPPDVPFDVPPDVPPDVPSIDAPPDIGLPDSPMDAGLGDGMCVDPLAPWDPFSNNCPDGGD